MDCTSFKSLSTGAGPTRRWGYSRCNGLCRPYVDRLTVAPSRHTSETCSFCMKGLLELPMATRSLRS